MSRSEKFWDRAAATYDREEAKDEQSTARAMVKTRKYLRVSDVVLDYACGTGTADIELARHVKRIHAIDASSRMIDLARRKTEGRGIENIDYVQATIDDGRLEIESIDVVTAFGILHLVEDTHGVIRRIGELLKPGGLFVSVTPCMAEKRISNVFLSLVGRAGLVPQTKAFKFSELWRAIADEGFDIVEAERLRQGAPLYFIAAAKRAKSTQRHL